MPEVTGSDRESIGSDADAGGLRPVRIHAELAERMTIVSSATANLCLAIGTLGQEGSTEPVLVSSIELLLRCDNEAIASDGSEFDVSDPFQRLVSWENAAFVVARLAEDLADVSAQVRAVSSGQIKPDAGRLRIVLGYMSQAQDEIARCLAEIEGISTIATEAGD